MSSSTTREERIAWGREHAFDPDVAEQLEEDCENGSLDFDDDEEAAAEEEEPEEEKERPEKVAKRTRRR
jgi:hypothetical protein